MRWPALDQTGLYLFRLYRHGSGRNPKAYLVIPLLGAFFIDIANASLVPLLLGLEVYAG